MAQKKIRIQPKNRSARVRLPADEEAYRYDQTGDVVIPTEKNEAEEFYRAHKPGKSDNEANRVDEEAYRYRKYLDKAYRKYVDKYVKGSSTAQPFDSDGNPIQHHNMAEASIQMMQADDDGWDKAMDILYPEREDG